MMLNCKAEFWLVANEDEVRLLKSPGGKPFVRLRLEDDRLVDVTVNLLAQLGAQARDIIDRHDLE